MSRHAFALAALVSLAFVVGCPQKPATAPLKNDAGADGAFTLRGSTNGLAFRVSDGQEESGRELTKRAETTPLSAADANRILAKLPPLVADPDDAKNFALRQKSLPAPRTGKTIDTPFPPPQGGPPPVSASTRPLTVERHAPEGDVELAPRLSVTFSEPMVPITSLTELEKRAPIVNLSPLPLGKWEWLGTQTAVFQPTSRFPMSTDYTVTIPKGTRAESGQTLTAPVSWSFSTPTLKLKRTAPSGNQVALSPLVFLGFDQEIAGEEIKRHLALTANGGQTIALRDATEAEIDEAQPPREPACSKSDPSCRDTDKTSAQRRTVALKPVSALTPGTKYTVTLKAGTGSAEGPKRTPADQSFSFETYGPMMLTEYKCGWRPEDCTPNSTFSLNFSNAIDSNAFEKSWIHVIPEIPGMRVSHSGQYLSIGGRLKGGATYSVMVTPEIKDVFGQALSNPKTISFKVGHAQAMVFGQPNEMSVLDPSAGKDVSIFSINRDTVRVRIYAVTPNDYGAYETYLRSWYEEKTVSLPGRLVSDEQVRIKNAVDDLVETRIGLAGALKDGFGHAIVEVDPPVRTKQNRYARAAYLTWVQVTNLGLSSVSDPSQVIGWVSALKDGAPVEGANLNCGGISSSTGKDGTASLATPACGTLVASKGTDSAFMHVQSPSPIADAVRWLVFDDRHLYKPGEDVRVKGWARTLEGRKGGDVVAVRAANLTWRAIDPRGTEIAKGTSTIDASGGFDFQWKLPNNANTGSATVHLTLDDSHDYSHRLMVQEFRRPEFEVSSRVSEGAHIAGLYGTATVSAKYYAGGGLPNAAVSWNISQSPAHFTPPNREEYSFGEAVVSPWWHPIRGANDSGKPLKKTYEVWSNHTDANGDATVRLDFDAIEPSYPVSLAIQGTVTDVNRQAWHSATTMLVHPADVYVGVKLTKPFVKAGEPIKLNTIVSDLDGHLVSDRAVTIKSARIDSEQVKGRWEQIERDVETCTSTSTKDPVACALNTKGAGRYQVTALVTDSKGRKSQTEVTVWVAGESMKRTREIDVNKVILLTDKHNYAPGDTAELLVMTPFAPAEGMFTLQRQGIVRTMRFRAEGSSTTLRVPLDDSMLPGIEAHVALVGSAPRENEDGEADPSLPRRPAFAEGSIKFSIPPFKRTFALEAKARQEKTEPGATTTVDVSLKDSDGKAAAGASVALVVVDESVLSLGGYKAPDPIALFYSPRANNADSTDLRSHVLLADASHLAMSGRPPGDLSGAGAGGGGVSESKGSMLRLGALKDSAPAATVAAAPPAAAPKMMRVSGESAPEPQTIALRSDFNALAHWAPRLTTDARGHAEASFKLPDNLTRYRIIAVAVRENTFGKGESSLTARLPLMVRPSAPRFLNFGDTFELPVVLQNQTDAPLTVEVAARSTNATLTGARGQRVNVPANDRVEVRFPTKAEKAGTARFQVAALSGGWADANSFSLPVWTPATTEAFATYGVIDDGAIAQPVKLPPGVFKEFGGLEVTTSSTALSSLTDALLYLVRYPFECNEQLASRILAVASLKDVLTAFHAEGLPSASALTASVDADLVKLKSRQSSNGGWGFWREDPWPYLTIHVAHALSRAKDKGYRIDPGMLQRAENYLANIERNIPHWYGPESRRTLVAYALYVRNRLGHPDAAKAQWVVKDAGGVESTPLETLGWLLPTLADDKSTTSLVASIRTHLANRVSETAGNAHFTSSYNDDNYLVLHSDRRADGVLLESLILTDKANTLIPKIASGLLAHRKAGRWTSTQENAFVLVALDTYFNTYEKTTPDFIARAWLGDGYAGEHAFKGYSTDRQQIDIPMNLLPTQAPENLTIQKDGPGRLYFRIGMQYAPTDLRPPPSEHGFAVTRLYEGADNKDDVTRDASGVWHVKAGSKVKVRVSMSVPSRRYHVALVDPIPAGFEPMNSAFAATGPIPLDPGSSRSRGPYWFWSRTWYEHENLRDERVEAFASLVWEGVHTYSYVARATTPGNFVVPPPKAEEMYNPETFGRGWGDRVVVE